MEHSPRRILALLILIGMLPQIRAEDAPAENPEWPRGWKLRVKAVATEAAETYDIQVQHDGVGLPDGRDVRVIGPDGQPVSHYVAYADNVRFRVLFDGNGGAGTYVIYFGNLISKVLPPVPDGVSAFGMGSPKAKKDWSPQGGYSCISFDPIEKIDRADMVNLEQVVKAYEKIRERVAAAEKKEAETQPLPAKRRKFQLKTAHRSANVDIGNVDAIELLRDEKVPAARVPQNWFHIFRAQIDVAKAETYQFQLGEGRAVESLGVLFVDGNLAKPVITGWHSNSQSTMGIVFDCIGKTELTAGKHVVELYTTRRNPEIKWNVLSGSAPPEYLRGLDANYDTTRQLKTSEMEAEKGLLAEVFLAAIKHWAGQDRFSLARALSRIAQTRFAGNPEKLKEFASAFEQAEQRAYETNWLTEGKFPDRSGSFAPTGELNFAPPLRQSGGSQENYAHDQRHLSSTVWVEGKLVYGLPFDIQETPWGITSGVCVADDVLYAGTKNGVMHAVNLSSATERWSFPGGGACLGCPLLYRDCVYFGSLDRRLYALDLKTGRMRWNFPANDWIEGSACIATGNGPAGGRIFFGSRDKNLYAIDAALGVERWHAALGSEIVGTPTTDAGNGAASGKVYIGTRAGDFFSVDAVSGSVAWKFSTHAAIAGGSCLHEGRVTFGDQAGKVYCLETATGKPTWKEPVDVGGPVIAAPIRVGSVIYGGTDNGKLWGIDADAGVLGWQMPMPGDGSVARPALFVDENLVFTSRQREMRQPDGNNREMRGATAVFQAAQSIQEKILQPKEPVTVDGNLSDPVWQQTKTAGAFYKHNGMAYGDAVEAKIAWEAGQLFVAVSSKNIDVSGSAENAAKELRSGDAVTIVLDPKQDGMAVCAFTVNPRGVKSQSIVTAVGRDPEDAKTKEQIAAMKLDALTAGWAPTWTAAASIQDSGWTAEIAIPFEAIPKQLAGPPQNNNQWKINVIVNRAGKSGTVEAWAFAPTGNAKGYGTPQRWPTFQFIGQGKK